MRNFKIFSIILIILCTGFTLYIPGMLSISSDVDQLVIDRYEQSATINITEYTNSNAGYEVYVTSLNDFRIDGVPYYFTYDGVEYKNPIGIVMLTDSIYRTPSSVTKEFTIYTTEIGRDQLTFTIIGK